LGGKTGLFFLKTILKLEHLFIDNFDFQLNNDSLHITHYTLQNKNSRNLERKSNLEGPIFKPNGVLSEKTYLRVKTEVTFLA